MPRIQEEPLPKPYKFVEISPLRREDRHAPFGHERYHPGTVEGSLQAVLVVRTPIHVWSGEIEPTGRADRPLVKSLVRVNGRPVVPGASLKGAVRSIVEAITRSCVRVTRADPRQLPSGAAACRQPDQLCVACRMFGSMGFQSNVRFSDAVLGPGWQPQIVTIPQLFAPRNREKVYYRDQQVVGRKFYMHGRPASGDTPIEVCPVGAELAFTLQFDNLTDGELGALLIALGQGDGQQAPRLWPKLGGGKPVCYGSVEVRVKALRVEKAGADAYASYDVPPPLLTSDWQPYFAAATSLTLPAQLRHLALILCLDEKRYCPDQNY